MRKFRIIVLTGIVAVASTFLIQGDEQTASVSQSRMAEELARKSAPITDLRDPRLVSVIVLFAMLSGSAALSSGASAFLLRKRNSAQYRELQTRMAELQALEEDQKRSLLEKEALLREIHHRVKNNMQIVSSLLSMQAARARDPYDQELFQESQNRIRAMASVHDQLYRSDDFSSIPAGEYLSDLVSGLESSWNRPDRWVRASVEADDTSLELDKAVPVGLIVNELVTNAFKYAFGPGESGTIRVGVRKTAAGGATLTVTDDGRGFPEGFDTHKGGGMGYTIINALVAQIGGDLSVSRLQAGGSEVAVAVPPPIRPQP